VSALLPPVHRRAPPDTDPGLPAAEARIIIGHYNTPVIWSLAMQASTRPSWLKPAAGARLTRRSVVSAAQPRARAAELALRLSATRCSLACHTPRPSHVLSRRQVALCASADKQLVTDEEVSITKVSFGTIGLAVGLTLLSAGFLGYFGFVGGRGAGARSAARRPAPSLRHQTTRCQHSSSSMASPSASSGSR